MNRKGNQSGGSVDSQDEKLKKLSEDGKYEIKELEVSSGEKTYKAIIRVDFDLFKKAYSVMLDTKFTSKGNSKEDSGVEVQMDLLGAGDKILFFGWHEGDEAIKEKLKLRAKAVQILGDWFTELIADDDDENDVEEKKS